MTGPLFWLQEVTKQQAKERAAERNLRGQPTLDAFIKQPAAAGTRPSAAPHKRKRTILKRAFAPLGDERELLSPFQRRRRNACVPANARLHWMSHLTQARISPS